MLKEFSLKGFGPFLNKETISFEPKSNIKKEHPNHIKNGLLPVLALYGPNGGGKSSLLHGLLDFKNIVIHGFESDNKFSSANYLNLIEPTKECEFEAIFIFDNDEFKYSIAFSNDGIESEVLLKNNNLIFKRQNEIIEVDKNILTMDIDSNTVNKKITLLKFLSTFFKINDVHIVLHEFQKIIYLDLEKYVSSFKVSLNSTQYNIGDPRELEKNKKFVLEVLKDVDINIVDFKFVKNPLDKNLYEKIISIKESNFGEKFELDLIQESSGTLRFIYLINLIIQLSHVNVTLLIDEIDSSLHTKLVEYLVKLIVTSSIGNNMQLIFTSHDFGILKKEVFRRDEIYFVGQNESHFSNIVNLFELKIKSEGSYSKQYLEGKFGFDPYVIYSKKFFS